MRRQGNIRAARIPNSRLFPPWFVVARLLSPLIFANAYFTPICRRWILLKRGSRKQSSEFRLIRYSMLRNVSRISARHFSFARAFGELPSARNRNWNWNRSGRWIFDLSLVSEDKRSVGGLFKLSKTPLNDYRRCGLANCTSRRKKHRALRNPPAKFPHG